MKALKIIILFIVVLSGCSRKYLNPGGKELVCREWSVLDAAIVAKDNHNLSLNLKVKDFVAVEDSLNIEEIYKYGFEKEDDIIGKDNSNVFLGLGAGCCGCLAVAGVLFMDMMDRKGEIPDCSKFAAISGFSAGLFLIIDGFRKNEKSSEFCKYSKVGSYYIRKNRKCINSELLFYSKVKVLLEKTDFEEIYWSDENGNVEFKFDEMIPEPTEADSVLNLIIRYYELVDTVEVRRL